MPGTVAEPLLHRDPPSSLCLPSRQPPALRCAPGAVPADVVTCPFGTVWAGPTRAWPYGASSRATSCLSRSLPGAGCLRLRGTGRHGLVRAHPAGSEERSLSHLRVPPSSPGRSAYGHSASPVGAQRAHLSAAPQTPPGPSPPRPPSSLRALFTRVAARRPALSQSRLPGHFFIGPVTPPAQSCPPGLRGLQVQIVTQQRTAPPQGPRGQVPTQPLRGQGSPRPEGRRSPQPSSRRTRSFLSVQKSRVWCLFCTTMNVIPGW